MITIREIENELSGLRRERNELVDQLDHWTQTEIAKVTEHWEGAIEELQVEVDHEIELAEREFKLERRQVPRTLRREATLRNIDARFHVFIQRK